MHRSMDEWIDGWVDEWMARWIGKMDGWMDDQRLIDGIEGTIGTF